MNLGEEKTQTGKDERDSDAVFVQALINLLHVVAVKDGSKLADDTTIAP